MRMRHVKTDHIYWISMLAVREADLVPLVIYYNEDGEVWARPAGEFFDGRFVAEPAPPPEEVGPDALDQPRRLN